WWILVGMGVDAIVVFADGLRSIPWRRAFRATAGISAISWGAWVPRRWAASPGRSESERRDAQIARGLDLRMRRVLSAVIEPCSFEHFALIAAWGEPEKASVLGRTGETPTGECPGVVEGKR